MPSWIRREGSRSRGFRYLTDKGGEIRDRRILDRIDALRVPPAWRDVHIARDARSEIQAWGFDARGRKQYRYHPRAVERGSLRKYYRVRRLAHDLPSVRAALARDLHAPAFSRKRVLAGAVSLLAEGFFRVGCEKYLEENRTFGLTTLNKRHVSVSGDSITFRFRGKSGVRQWQVIVNRTLAGFVRGQLRSPGKRLLRYREHGVWCDLSAPQVNAYVRDIAGRAYSSKDFRTWGGTLRAATVLSELGPAETERDAKRQVTLALRLVAAELGNTPAVCRSSYVHPMVLARYLDAGEVITPPRSRRGGGHAPEERALITFLEKHFPDRRRKESRSLERERRVA
jgi:DNA topoisomerase I